MLTKDFHIEDLKAQLRKQFGSLRKFERTYNIPRYSASAALRRPHQRAEAAVAKALGIAPHVIWPSRYRSNGERHPVQPRQNYAPARGGQK